MPTYVYRCRKGHTFELFHSISDETAKRCPQCRSSAKRVPAGGSGLLFKGSGFYITDYRKPGYKDSAKRDSAAKSDPAPAAGAGAGTAPAAGGSGSAAKDKSERPSRGSSHRASDSSSHRSPRKPDR